MGKTYNFYVNNLKKKSVPASYILSQSEIAKFYSKSGLQVISPDEEDYHPTKSTDPSLFNVDVFFMNGLSYRDPGNSLESGQVPRKQNFVVYGYENKVFLELKEFSKPRISSTTQLLRSKGKNMPVIKKWTKNVIKALIQFFKNEMCKIRHSRGGGAKWCRGGGPLVDFGDKKWFKKVFLEGWRNLRGRKEMKGLVLPFPSEDAAKSFANLINGWGKYTSKSVSSYGIQLTVDGQKKFLMQCSRQKTFSIRVHQHKIPAEIKLMTELGLNMNGWVSGDEQYPEAIENVLLSADDLPLLDKDTLNDGVFSTFVKWDSLRKFTPPKPTLLRRRYVSFDIETYSSNPNSKLPDPLIRANKVYQIAVMVGYLDTGIVDKKYLLTLFKAPKEGIRVPYNLQSSAKIGKGKNRFGDDMETVTYIPDEGDNYETLFPHEFGCESDMILFFSRLMKKECPEIILTYNGLKFDWEYLLERSRILGIEDEFLDMTNETVLFTPQTRNETYVINDILTEYIDPDRLLFQQATAEQRKWSSNAYGEQVFKWVDSPVGVDFDMLPEIERNNRLSSYSLKFVSKHFLKDTKDDISARQLFMIVDMNNLFETKWSKDYTSKIKKLRRCSKKRSRSSSVAAKKLSTSAPRAEFSIEQQAWESVSYDIRSSLEKLMPLRKCGDGEMLELRNDLENCPNFETLQEICARAVSISGKYCVQDTALPIRLAEHLSVYSSMEQLSNVCNIPMSWLNIRGQQIKVVSHVYKILQKLKFILPFTLKGETSEENYEGATVIEAIRGIYNNVIPLDFASLYPTTMISYNICYSTFAPEGSVWQFGPKKGELILDEECYIIQYSSHVGCEHDKKKRKKDNDKISCGEYRYRYIRPLLIFEKRNESELTDREIDEIRAGNFKSAYTQSYEGRGIFPIMEETLLSERKKVKKELAKAQALYDTATGKADDNDLAFYTSRGWETHEPDSLNPTELHLLKELVSTLDSNQKALKVTANSAYGILGAKKGMMPFIPGAGSVTAMGRFLIKLSILVIELRWKNALLVYGDTDSCMWYFKGKTLAESFALGDESGRLATHVIKCSILNIPTREMYELRLAGQVNHPSVSDANLAKFTEFSIRNSLRRGEKSEGDPYELGEWLYESPDEWKAFGQNWENVIHDYKTLVYMYDTMPMELEPEGAYGRFILLTKKRYIAKNMNRKGEVKKETWKGVVATRRDNSGYLRRVYKKIGNRMLNYPNELDENGVPRGVEISPEEIMEMIEEIVDDLFRRKISSIEYVIYQGVKTLMRYAKRQPKNTPGIKHDDERLYIDSEGNVLRPQPTHANDPRLVYPNYPQVLLAKKIIERAGGNPEAVPANTRLEFLFLRNLKKQHQGEGAEEYSYYLENKKDSALEGSYKDLAGDNTMKLDNLYMLEKQLSKPLKELLEVVLPSRRKLFYDAEILARTIRKGTELPALEEDRLVHSSIESRKVCDYTHKLLDGLYSSDKDSYAIKRVRSREDVCKNRCNNDCNNDRFGGRNDFVVTGWKALENSINFENGISTSTTSLSNGKQICAMSKPQVLSDFPDFMEYKYTKNKGLDAVVDFLHTECIDESLKHSYSSTKNESITHGISSYSKSDETSSSPSHVGYKAGPSVSSSLTLIKNKVDAKINTFLFEKVSQLKSQLILDKVSWKYGAPKHINYFKPKTTSEKLQLNLPVVLRLGDIRKLCDSSVVQKIEKFLRGREITDDTLVAAVVTERYAQVHDVIEDYTIDMEDSDDGTVTESMTGNTESDSSRKILKYEEYRIWEKQEMDRRKKIKKLLKDKKTCEEAFDSIVKNAKKTLSNGRYNITEYVKNHTRYVTPQVDFLFDLYIPLQKAALDTILNEDEDDDNDKDIDDHQLIIDGEGVAAEVFLSKVPRELIQVFYDPSTKYTLQLINGRKGWFEVNLHLQRIFDEIEREEADEEK